MFTLFALFISLFFGKILGPGGQGQLDYSLLDHRWSDLRPLESVPLTCENLPQLLAMDDLHANQNGMFVHVHKHVRNLPEETGSRQNCTYDPENLSVEV